MMDLKWEPDDSGVKLIPNKPYCGVYWIITTCLTGIGLGVGVGALLWLVLS